MNDTPAAEEPPKESAVVAHATPASPLPEIDAEQMEILRAELRAQENLPLGIAAGLIAALLGAVAWAVVTVVTGFQIGYMAIGVGYLVGYAVKKFGRGAGTVFGIVGAVCALIGCLCGNLLSTCGFIAQAEGLPLFQVVRAVFSQPELIVTLFKETFSPIDLLFYAIAIHGGYHTAIRTLTADEIKQMTS